MSRPTNPLCSEMRARRASGPVLAALGLLLVLLPVAALSADPQQEKPADKRSPAPAATADKTTTKKDAPARSASAALRFTDEDLEKYHKPKAVEPEEVLEEELDLEEPSPGAIPTTPPPTAPPKAAPAQPFPPKPHPALVRTPPKAAKPPAEDPLKPWKDRDAMEVFRQEQLQALRQKIAGVQSRLDYLTAKKGAISNPNPVQVGGTGGRAFQYDENGNPVIDPVTKKPVTTPDISPGRAQPKVLPIFPALPEPQTDEDRENDKRMKSKQLLEHVEEEIKTVEEELEQLRRDMVSIETRFAQETAPR